jgi:hypothetical protein
MSLKADLLAYLDSRPAITLAERKSHQETYANLPDELYEMAEAMSSKGSESPLLERVGNLVTVTTEVMKLVEAGSPGVDDFALRFSQPLACVGALHGWSGSKHGKGGAEAEPEPPMTFAESRPDVMLAKVAEEIRLSEGVDYGAAMGLALERDPLLRFRLNDADHARSRSRAVPVKPPKGFRLSETPADVELAERAESLAASEGIGVPAAMKRILHDDPKLKSRYHDYTLGENALDELKYRVESIRLASGGRVSVQKATDAALAEDPMLRDGVNAYFERNPYKSTN